MGRTTELDRGVAWRVLVATVLAAAAAAVVYAVAFENPRAWADPVFLGGMLAFVVVTWALVTWLYRGHRGERWVAAREKRWILAGVLIGVGELVLLVLLLVVSLADLAVHPHQYGSLSPGSAAGNAVLLAVVAWLYGSAMTGLPLWLLLTGLGIGPTGRTSRIDAAQQPSPC